MLKLPELEVIRDEQEEAWLVSQTKKWLESEGKGRDKRIHASDLLDPRKAYWNAQHKEPVTTRMVGNFFVGKILHAFFSTTMNEKKGVSLEDTDVGGTWDEELGISYSNDWQNEEGVPYELKTSRAINEQSKKDLSSYLEQLCIYIAAKKAQFGKLVVLRLMAKDAEKGWGTYPQYRAYEVSWSKKDMLDYRAQIKRVAKLLKKALTTKKVADIKNLPLCRDWKCGESNCGQWKYCKPEGRYGDKKWQK